MYTAPYTYGSSYPVRLSDGQLSTTGIYRSSCENKLLFKNCNTSASGYIPCLEASLGCGPQIVNLGDFGGEVKIASPNWPSNYGSDHDCSWQINAASASSQIRVQAETFNYVSCNQSLMTTTFE